MASNASLGPRFSKEMLDMSAFDVTQLLSAQEALPDEEKMIPPWMEEVLHAEVSRSYSPSRIAERIFQAQSYAPSPAVFNGVVSPPNTPTDSEAVSTSTSPKFDMSEIVQPSPLKAESFTERMQFQEDIPAEVGSLPSEPFLESSVPVHPFVVSIFPIRDHRLISAAQLVFHRRYCKQMYQRDLFVNGFERPVTRKTSPLKDSL